MCRRRTPTARCSAQSRADEILQIIFNEIDHPSSFVLACRRFHSFSRDPYVRAHYFLSRYGSVQALYWALGRGQLVTEQVIDVSAPLLSAASYMRGLLTSGAGFVEQRRASLSVPRADRGPPLLPFFLPLHQDPLGSDFEFSYFCTFLEPIVGEIWDNKRGEGRG